MIWQLPELYYFNAFCAFLCFLRQFDKLVQKFRAVFYFTLRFDEIFFEKCKIRKSKDEVGISSVNFRSKFSCSHLNQKKDEFIFSALAFKMGQIKKMKALYYNN